MASQDGTEATRGARPRTLTEQARRAQLIDVTVALVAEHGYGGTSLARIAEGAGITKAAVLYHFSSKDTVVDAAHEYVLTGLTEHVGAAVEAAEPTAAPGAYVRAMVGHLREHPHHTRMIVEAMARDGSPTAPAERWRPLASLLEAARAADGRTGDLDLRTVALATSGAIDAVVAEHLTDPEYDTAVAAETLVSALERTLFS